jgi:WD40 repeat protein
VQSEANSTEGSRIVSGGGNSSVWLWDADRCAAMGEPMHGHARQRDCASVVSSSGATMCKPLRKHDKFVYLGALNSGGLGVVSGGEDMTMRVWVTKNGECPERCGLFPQGRRPFHGSIDRPDAVGADRGKINVRGWCLDLPVNL